jgi:DNA-nicking Smr family endonuclease
MSLDSEDAEIIEVPIDGILDLHTFSPKDVKDLIPDYLQACRERGILEVRIIHGKGSGSLRRTVHSILDKLPGVVTFSQAPDESGGWGATILTLRPLK